MQNGMIIEVAVKGMERIDLAGFGLQHAPVDHYWRVRWIEDGQTVDQDCQFNDLAGMQRLARYYATSDPVAWRYYETDVFADDGERDRFLAAHGQPA